MKEKMQNMEQVAIARENEMKILKKEAARKEFESPDDKKKFQPLNAFSNRLNRLTDKVARSSDPSMRKSGSS